jgi:hypothetical protein
MTTTAQFKTRLSEDYTRDPNYSVRKESAVERALDKWYTQLQRDLWRDTGANEDTATDTSVSWTELYDVPTWFVRMQLVRYDGEELVRTTREQTRRRDENTQSWTPDYYYIHWDKVGLYPVPDDSKTIDYQYLGQQTSLSSVWSSALPDICDDAITLYAAYKLFLGVRDSNSASLMKQDYLDEVNMLRSTLLFNDENMTFSYEVNTRNTWPKVLD